MFNSIKVNPPKRNKFDLGHEKKLTCNMGELIPILVQDVVPGDSFQARSEIFMRFAPMIAPIMHRVDVYTHYFFVPNRLVWSEFEEFITGGKLANAAPIFPQISIDTLDTVKLGSLADYMGVPASNGLGPVPQNVLTISSLPFKAYQTIYNEYYRDQNLSDEVPFTKDSGIIASNSPEALEILELRKRSWEKDYFTSALPWPQRGTQQAKIPIAIDYYTQPDGSAAAGAAAFTLGSLTAGGLAATGIDTKTGTINDLRKAVRIQEWLEKAARGGARYIEFIKSMFGVNSSDARLQRPSYLGGGKQVVKISEVLSTFDNTAGDLPQGNMSGHGVSSGQTHGFTASFEEHGYVIGIMSVLPKSAYQQGIPKHFRKFDKFDFYWPSFAHLGEQPVEMTELFWDWDTVNIQDPKQVFGYQSRYAEYKFGLSTVHGDFRENLAYWHLGRIFGTKPALNEAFVTADNAEMDRIFAVTDPDSDKLWIQIYNDVNALRPMPYFGTPTL